MCHMSLALMTVTYDYPACAMSKFPYVAGTNDYDIMFTQCVPYHMRHMSLALMTVTYDYLVCAIS